MSIDPTRLLVLGAVRQEQPASGYAIMRELTGWGVQDWASINPGSIYGALRALDKERLIALDTDSAPKAARTHKTSSKYALTAEGQAVFAGMLRTALHEVEPYRPAPLMAALCFLVDLPRDDAIDAIRKRIAGLEHQRRQFDADERRKPHEADKPEHSIEFVRLAASRLGGELAYVRSLLDRLESGSYTFSKTPAPSA
jgi:DNA-binding PadR family transcriptional regulator